VDELMKALGLDGVSKSEVSRSTVKSEEAERFESYAHAKEVLFDYIEVFYKQRRRHSTLGQSVRPSSSDGPLTRHSQSVHEIGSRPCSLL
jgi:hypothetical protein